MPETADALPALLKEREAKIKSIGLLEETVAEATNNLKIGRSELAAINIRLAKELGLTGSSGSATPRSTGGVSNLASQNHRKAYLNDVRAWAPKNGFELKGNGRVPAAIEEAYVKATGNKYVELTA